MLYLVHKAPTFVGSRRGHGKHLYPQLLKIKKKKKKKRVEEEEEEKNYSILIGIQVQRAP